MTDHNPSDQNPAAPSENVYAQPFGVDVSFPETVSIRMVDASALNDYEVLLLFSGLFCNVFSGFVVAAITTKPVNWLMWIISAVFLFFTVGFMVWALIKRASMTKKAQKFKLKGDAVGKMP